MTLDFEGAAKKIADNRPKKGLDQLQALVDEADMLDAGMDDLQQQLNSMIARYNEIKTKLLPTKLQELQTSSWKNTSGTTVELDSFVSGSLPKEDPERAEAIKYLVENGGEPLVQTELVIGFKKSQHNEALALADDLRKQGHEPVLTSGVNAMSLQAYVRERMKKGEKVDVKKIGIHTGSVAKITHAGKSKPTKVSKGKKKTT